MYTHTQIHTLTHTHPTLLLAVSLPKESLSFLSYFWKGQSWKHVKKEEAFSFFPIIIIGTNRILFQVCSTTDSSQLLITSYDLLVSGLTTVLQIICLNKEPACSILSLNAELYIMECNGLYFIINRIWGISQAVVFSFLSEKC